MADPSIQISQGGFGPVLANRAFLVMWLGQVFSQTADKLVFILLVSIVGELSTSSTVMSTSLALQSAPNVILGAAAGVLVDRYDKRRVMMGTNVLRALFVLLLGLFGHTSIALAVGLAFIVACCAQPFIPAEAAAMPLVVKKEHLLQANSLFATTMIGSIIVAFTLGEPLIQWLGTEWASYVTAGGFAISVLFLFFVRYTQADSHASRHQPFLDQLREGFAYIAASARIRSTLWMQVALFAMFAAMSVLAIIFAKQELKTNFSWFLAMAGAGMAAGSWLIAHFGHGWNQGRVVSGGFGMSGVVLLVLAMLGADHKLLAFGVAFLLGLSSSFVAVPLQTRLQELVGEEMRGKVFGAQNTLLNIATTLPLALAGFLADWIGLRLVIAMTAGLMAIACALSVRSFRSLGFLAPPALAPEGPSASEPPST